MAYFGAILEDESVREDPDRELMLKDPSALVLKYNEMIRIIVLRCAGRRLQVGEGIGGLVDTVTSELMLRMSSIQAHYNGTSLVKTYVSAVVRNICLAMWANRPPTESLEGIGHLSIPHTSIAERHSINQARSAFRAILLQYGRTLPKVIVCLKLKFRMQLENEDILRWQPGCEERVLSDFFVDYRSWPDSMTDMEVFERCRSIFNLLQRNETTADTIRRWTTSKIAEIAETLDSSIPGAHFDEESIRILTEDYFSPFLLPD